MTKRIMMIGMMTALLGLGSMARADHESDLQDPNRRPQSELDQIKAEHQFDVDRSGYHCPTGWAKSWAGRENKASG